MITATMHNYSVLMSVYKGEKADWFSEALQSVWDNQTLRPGQIVLVKDGPLTEDLDKVVTEFTQRCDVLTIVQLAKNGGLGAALNEGLKHCRYDIVARMDTDDICFPDRFEKQVDFMSKHEEIDVLSSWIQEFTMVNGKRKVTKIKKLPCSHEELFVYGKTRCPINHPVCVYRKSKVEQVGGYGVFPEDYYLWSKLMMAGCKFYNMQECLLNFRVNPDVFKRRGGWKYLKAEYKCQRFMWRIGYLSFPVFLKNCIIRFSVRMMPNGIRGFVYSNLIRR